MPTNYPEGLDTFDNPKPNSSQAASRTHSEQHSDANDSLEALQRKVGTNLSADPDSMDFKVGALENLTEGLGSAAFETVDKFASATQGQRADSAVQPGALDAATQGLQTQIDGLVDGQQTSAIYADTLSDLQAVTGTYDGQGAYVTNGAGAGTYRWTSATSSWVFLRPDALGLKADKTALVDAVGGFVRLGNPAPAAGTGSSANANFILSASPARAGYLLTLAINARAAGTVNVGVYRAVNGPPAIPGSVLTRVATIPLSVAAGANTLDLRALNIAVQDGDLVGVSGNGIVGYSTVSAGGPRYYSVTGTSPTLGNLINDNRWEFGIDIEFRYSTGTPIGKDVFNVAAVVRDPVNGLDTKPSRDEFAKTLGSNLQRLANPTPQVGTPYASGATIVCTTPVVSADRITKLTIGSASTTTGSLVVYRPPAGVAPAPGVAVSRVLVHPIALVPGVNVLTGAALPDLILQPGDLIGISANGALTYTTVSAGGPRYYQVSGASATLSNPINDNRWEWGAEVGIGFSEDDPLYPAVEQLVQQYAGVQLRPLIGYILVWGVGQSGMAGRAETPSAYKVGPGQGYKFDVDANALVQLVDPTGTDDIARTGRTSVGPALAQTVLDGTGGRFGVVFVNAAVGSTTISMWGPTGSAWVAAVPKWNAAVADAVAKKLNIVGCVAAMIQGETDAGQGTSPEAWKAGALSLRDRMRAVTGIPTLPLIISQIGVDTDVPNSPAWAALRAAQSELARAGEVIMASRGAKYFAERGLMHDRLHYNAKGLDEIGLALGEAVVAVALGKAPVEFDG